MIAKRKRIGACSRVRLNPKMFAGELNMLKMMGTGMTGELNMLRMMCAGMTEEVDSL